MLTFKDLFGINFTPVPVGGLLKISDKFASVEHIYGRQSARVDPESDLKIGETGLFWLKGDSTIIIVIGDKKLTIGKTDLNSPDNGVIFKEIVSFSLDSSLTSSSILLKCIKTASGLLQKQQ